ncbi:hypothetical protein [Flavipsychrobacter stenotrophus]|nr:hypothetical protein [Flavipsychrobacter stenotrophus]
MKHKITDRMVFTGTCLGYGLFLLYVACSFLPVEALHNRYVNRRVASTLYVPRWDLYTASPQTTISKLYRVDGNKITEVDMRPFVPDFMFGLDRRPKVLAQEVSVIVDDKRLLSTMHPYLILAPEDGYIQQFIGADTLVYTPVSKPQITLLKGKYIIAMYDAASWDMRKDSRRKITPMYIVAVNIAAP